MTESIVFTSREVAKRLHMSPHEVVVVAKMLHIPKRSYGWYKFNERDIEIIEKYIQEAEY